MSAKKIFVLVVILILAVVIHRVQIKKDGLTVGEYTVRLLAGRRSAGRVAYLDYLRILATAFVIMIHVCGCLQLTLTEGTGTYSILSFLTGLCICCNPLFLMISGALLLGKRTESLTQFYCRRFMAVLLPCFLYYLFYRYAYLGISALYPENWYLVIQNFLANDSGFTPHYWLIYEILLCYIAAPFFADMISAMDEKRLSGFMIVILVLHTIYTYLPMLGMPLYSATFLASWPSVFIMGYFCTTQTAMKYYRAFQVSGVISVILIGIGIVRDWPVTALFYNNATPMLLMGAMVFLFFRKHKDTLFSKIPAVIAFLSKYSFSVLLIHWYILYFIVEEYFKAIIAPLGTAAEFILTVLLTGACSLVFVVLFDNTVLLIADKILDAAGSAVTRIFSHTSLTE